VAISCVQLGLNNLGCNPNITLDESTNVFDILISFANRSLLITRSKAPDVCIGLPIVSTCFLTIFCVCPPFCNSFVISITAPSISRVIDV
jgi:hypothetical protein